MLRRARPSAAARGPTAPASPGCAADSPAQSERRCAVQVALDGAAQMRAWPRWSSRAPHRAELAQPPSRSGRPAEVEPGLFESALGEPTGAAGEQPEDVSRVRAGVNDVGESEGLETLRPDRLLAAWMAPRDEDRAMAGGEGLKCRVVPRHAQDGAGSREPLAAGLRGA